jgi:hypothetical protein
MHVGQELGYVLYGRDAAHPNDVSTQGPQAAAFPRGERDRPPHPGFAPGTDLEVAMEDDLLGLETYRQAQEGSLKPASQLHAMRRGLAFRAGPFPEGPLDMVDQPPTPEFRSKVSIAFQAHCVVQKARRRQGRPPVISSQRQR